MIAYRLLGEPIEVDTDGDIGNNKYVLEVKSAKGLLTTFAHCCHQFQAILSSLMPARKGLVIHHECCANLKNRKDGAERYTPVEWEKSDVKADFETELRIEMLNQQGALPEFNLCDLLVRKQYS